MAKDVLRMTAVEEPSSLTSCVCTGHFSAISFLGCFLGLENIRKWLLAPLCWCEQPPAAALSQPELSWQQLLEAARAIKEQWLEASCTEKKRQRLQVSWLSWEALDHGFLRQRQEGRLTWELIWEGESPS